ncbi:MAG: hypothetical protein N3A55_08715 [Methylohalobius sp.]|nr:hypothetical protein [Methylohalobius sp.]
MKKREKTKTLYPFYEDTGFCARWASYGYDIDAANKRREEFRHRIAKMKPEDVFDAAFEFEENEKAIAIAQGVPEDDPDLWRFETACKHYVL